jgi:hypothetical protein
LYEKQSRLINMGKHGGSRAGAGRKAGEPNKANRDLREIAGVYTEEAVATMVKIMREGEMESARLLAADKLLDRGHGKAVQQAIIDQTITNKWIGPPPLTNDEWESSRAKSTNGSGATEH